MKVCCFTGHRNIGKTKLDRVTGFVNEAILDAINSGVTEFITGGAVGFDTIAAEQVLFMREDYRDIRLNLYIPCKNHTVRWTEENRKRFERILSLSDSVKYVSSDSYREGCMQKRNAAMIADSDMCIAYMNNPYSGTGQTLKLAEEKDIKIVNIAGLV